METTREGEGSRRRSTYHEVAVGRDEGLVAKLVLQVNAKGLDAVAPRIGR